MSKNEKISLNAEKRLGSVGQDKLPAVLYGPKTENTPLFVDLGEFKKVWRAAGESTVVELNIGGSKTPVLIYDVQLHPVSGEPQHVDFYAVDMTKKITAEVPLEFSGEAPAIKLGGTLVKVIHEIEVESLPADLPHELKVDISRLAAFDDRILIKDIEVPAEVKILAELDEVVALVEEVKEEVAEEERTLEDIEVMKEKKDEDGEKKGEPGEADNENKKQETEEGNK